MICIDCKVYLNVPNNSLPRFIRQNHVKASNILNCCHKIKPAHSMITKRDFILCGSYFCEKYILGSEMIGNINMITKSFDFEERVLIGWVANTVREPANQDTYLKVQHLCN